MPEHHVSHSCVICLDKVHRWMNIHNTLFQLSDRFHCCFSVVTAVQTPTFIRYCALWCASRWPSANGEGWWISSDVHTQTLSCLIRQSGRLWKQETDYLQLSTVHNERSCKFINVLIAVAPLNQGQILQLGFSSAGRIQLYTVDFEFYFLSCCEMS